MAFTSIPASGASDHQIPDSTPNPAFFNSNDPKEALQAQTEMLGRVAHDLRAHINQFIAIHHLLIRENCNEESTKTLKETHGEVARKSLDLISSLTNFSKDYQQLDLASHDLKELLLNHIKIYKCELQMYDMELVAIIPNGLIAMVDPQALIRILDNLTANARKFSSPGTKVTIKAASTENGILLSVKDEGKGIKKDEIPYLFQPFSRFDQSQQGHGLGLSIVSLLVSRMGGKVWAESKPGKGSTFNVYLQAASK